MTVKKISYIILPVIVLITILSFDLQSGSVSSGYSIKVSKAFVKLFITQDVAEAWMYIPRVDTYVRKIAHVIEFFILGITTILVLMKLMKVRMACGLALMIGCIVAFTSEFIQVYRNAGRTGRVSDVILDMMAYSSAVSVGLLINHHRQKNLSKQVQYDEV